MGGRPEFPFFLPFLKYHDGHQLKQHLHNLNLIFQVFFLIHLLYQQLDILYNNGSLFFTGKYLSSHSSFS